VLIRRSSDDDLDAIRDWATGDHPSDQESPYRRSVVALEGTEVVGVASSHESRIHPTRLWLSVDVREGHRRRGLGTAVVRALTSDGRPYTLKLFTSDEALAFATSLGARVIQTCPPEVVDCSSAGVRDWARLHLGHTVSGQTVSAEQILTGWLDMYEWIHADWSPMGRREDVVDVFRSMLADELDLERSRFVLRAGRISAGAYVFRATSGAVREVVAEPSRRAGDWNRADLAACMAAVIAAGADDNPSGLQFDGHLSDPDFYPLLQTIPGVTGPTLLILEI
jgi:GNAT superfamily N-acetyltransferase